MANEPRLAIESIAGLRPYQEDAVLAETLSDGRVLVAVADGMGGHAAGEVASALALETLVQAVREGLTLVEAFTLANARVFHQAKEPGKQGMGTTLVAALVHDGAVELANVGDSRGYVIGEDGITQVTEDHSFVAEAVKRGQSEAEAMAGPWKDALTRSIGTEPKVDVDTFGPLPLSENSALVVCSDGLYKTLSDNDLLRIYSQSGGPRGAAQSLVSTALEKGSDDNISVAIAEYGDVRRDIMGNTVPLEYRPVASDATTVAEVDPVSPPPAGPDDEILVSDAEMRTYLGGPDSADEAEDTEIRTLTAEQLPVTATMEESPEASPIENLLLVPIAVVVLIAAIIAFVLLG